PYTAGGAVASSAARSVTDSVGRPGVAGRSQEQTNVDQHGRANIVRTISGAGGGAARLGCGSKPSGLRRGRPRRGKGGGGRARSGAGRSERRRGSWETRGTDRPPSGFASVYGTVAWQARAVRTSGWCP